MNELASSPLSPVKAIFLTLGRGMIELLFYTPILLTFGIYFIAETMIVWWYVGLLVCYTLPHIVIRRGRKLTNTMRIVLDLLLAVISIAWVYPHIVVKYPIIGLLLGLIIGLFIVERSIRSLLSSWRESFDHPLMIAGLIFVIVMQVLKVVSLEKIASYNLVFNLTGMLAFIVYLYIANERLIKEHSVINQKKAAIRSSVRQNRLLITIFSVFIISISLFRQFQQAIEEQIYSALRALLLWLTSSKQSYEPIAEEPLPPQIEMGLDVVAKEKSMFIHYLEIVLQYVFFIIILILFLILIYKFGKKAYSTVLSLIAKLLRRHQTVNEEEVSYTDEIVALESVHARKKREKSKVKKDKKLTDARWRAMSDEEKARTLYRFVIREEQRRGYQHNVTLTPAETLTEVGAGEYLASGMQKLNQQQLQLLLNEYEKSRYSEQAPTEAILQSLYDSLVKKE